VTPLRIALVITELEVGGAEKCLVRLATGLDRARFSPVVYSLAPLPPAGKDQLVHTLSEARIEVHSLGAHRFWHFFSAMRKLAALFRQQQPQIVQTFLFHANVMGVMAARRTKVPHVLLGIRVADASWWRGALERSLAARASGVVCVSQAVADFCRSRHKFPAGKLVVVPNGIEVESVGRTPPIDLVALGISAGRKLLTFIGRLDQQKDPLMLLGIAEQCLPKLPDHDLVIVGEGPLRQGIERFIAGSSLRDRVHLLGWRPDALAVLAASEMLLLTSKYEGMPNVVLEAMALGKPVMASRVEGVVELLGAAADDQTAECDGNENFTRKLVALAADPARCDRLGRLNQARAREHYSVERMVSAYARLYEGLGGC